MSGYQVTFGVSAALLVISCSPGCHDLTHGSVPADRDEQLDNKQRAYRRLVLRSGSWPTHSIYEQSS